MSRVEHIAEGVTLYLGDCREILPTLDGFDAVVTDPPYPDVEKGFAITPIGLLATMPIQQFVFWSPVAEFPLDWTAIHIWHKPNGAVSQHYERIFERNGRKAYLVFREPTINSIMAAQLCRDEFHDHPTQKPISLTRELIGLCSKAGETVFDPFVGSGTTGVAAVSLGRQFTGIEIEPKYFDIACRRIAGATKQQDLFIEKPKPVKQEVML